MCASSSELVDPPAVAAVADGALGAQVLGGGGLGLADGGGEVADAQLAGLQQRVTIRG